MKNVNIRNRNEKVRLMKIQNQFQQVKLQVCDIIQCNAKKVS